MSGSQYQYTCISLINLPKVTFVQNISQGKSLWYNVVHLMRLDIKRCQFKSDKRPWFYLMHVKELVACLLGVRHASPTDEGYAPTMFPC